MNWVAIRAAIARWVVSCTGLSDQKVVWSRQRNTPRPAEDAIIMKLYVVDDQGMSWVDHEPNYLEFADKTITGVSGNNLQVTGHQLETGDGPIVLHGADLPLPLVDGTQYWVIKTDANSFQVAASYDDTGGNFVGNPVTPIVLTDAGSGVMTLAAVPNKTFRAGQELEFVQRGTVRATLQLFSYVQDDTGINGAIATLRRVANRYKLPSNKQILDAVGVSVASMERTRSMLGTRDAVLFEPRAWIDIELNMAFEEREFGTPIGRVGIEQQEPSPTWTALVEDPDL